MASRMLALPRRRLALIALGLALFAGCARPPSGGEPDAVLAPNPNLVVQGIAPIPRTLVERVERYTDFRGHRLLDWHPARLAMITAHRKAGASTPQVFLIEGPLATPQQLTPDAEPIWSARFEPVHGRFLVFERSAGGNEANQLYRLDLDTRQITLLTNPGERHEMVSWLHAGGRLLVRSLPLDRTAPGGRRTEVQTRLWLLDPLDPSRSTAVATLPGGGWFDGEITPDDRQVALLHYVSAAESEIWLIDLATGQRRRLLPSAAEPAAASYYPGAFSPDGRSLWITSNRGSEFLQLMRMDLATGRLEPFGPPTPWDVNGIEASRDGRTLAVSVNVDGRTELRLIDTASGSARALPSMPGGSVRRLRLQGGSGAVAFEVDSAQGQGQVHVLDAAGRVGIWARAEAAAGVDPSRFADQRVIRWSSFDGRTISGLLSTPPKRFSGPRPVLIDIHGGPEGQAQVGFLGRYNYLVEEMGIAIIRPNVRGSSGFGKTFLALDNGMLREDSVRDIGALLDWIATQPALDASRVMVAGGSYGGYMSLAVSVHYADRIAGAVDDVGISHFVTFLENTESYRRDLRRVEYGDERDPAMRAFLDRISPLTQAHRIRKPLFVVQGRNDPRVPYTEAEQIVARARANGTTVWYLRAENEGHGFVRKENADFRFYAMVKFIETVLRGHPGPAAASTGGQ